ncbi:MAG TPA: cytochrome c oxidase assembly protein [Gaiellaceae bacterium]|nr:cytochrome c oxidase assembly protein [Gaiellaceae bacterium]
MPALALVVVAAVLYVLGGRRRVSGRHGHEQTGRTIAFALALLAIVVALDSPLDDLADKLFLAHMAQHVLLLAVAPPLLVVSAPWTRLWQPLPLRFRRAVAGAVAVSPRARPLRAAAHAVAHPLAAWTLASATLVVWHLPAAYDLTLRSGAVHELEHALFFLTSLLFWGAVVDSPPFRSRLDWPQRIGFVVSGMLVGWVLSLVLAFAGSPLYAPYAALAHRPGGLSALADQRLAAGVMWVPGSLAYTIAVVVFVYRWLDPAPARRRLGLAGR